jgi:hypothetical protein
LAPSHACSVGRSVLAGDLRHAVVVHQPQSPGRGGGSAAARLDGGAGSHVAVSSVRDSGGREVGSRAALATTAVRRRPVRWQPGVGCLALVFCGACHGALAGQDDHSRDDRSRRAAPAARRYPGNRFGGGRWTGAAGRAACLRGPRSCRPSRSVGPGRGARRRTMPTAQLCRGGFGRAGATGAVGGLLAVATRSVVGRVSRGCRGRRGPRPSACSGLASRWVGSGGRARVP